MKRILTAIAVILTGWAIFDLAIKPHLEAKQGEQALPKESQGVETQTEKAVVHKWQRGEVVFLRTKTTKQVILLYGAPHVMIRVTRHIEGKLTKRDRVDGVIRMIVGPRHEATISGTVNRTDVRWHTAGDGWTERIGVVDVTLATSAAYDDLPPDAEEQ